MNSGFIVDKNMVMKLGRYLAQGGIIYLLFSYMPKRKMRNNEVLLITLVILLIYILLENLCTLGGAMVKKTNEAFTTQQDQCKCEGFTSFPSNETDPDTVPIPVPTATEVATTSTDNVILPTTNSPMPADTSTETTTGVVKDAKETNSTLLPSKKDYTEIIDDAKKQRINTRYEKGVMDDEMKYTDFNHLPMASGYLSKNYEHGFSFLPPEKWYPEPPRPPICVAEKRCPVMPMYAQGLPADVKEWDTSRRITGPIEVDTEYIEEKMNSGR